MIQTMYIGPTIPGLLRENVIYQGKLPEKVAKMAEKASDFKRLLVPVSKVADARKQLKINGSAIYVSYQTVKNSL